jgi:hypothetical protein
MNVKRLCEHAEHCFKLKRLLTALLAGGEIEKNEMGGACSAYGGWERRVQGFGGKT